MRSVRVRLLIGLMTVAVYLSVGWATATTARAAGTTLTFDEPAGGMVGAYHWREAGFDIRGIEMFHRGPGFDPTDSDFEILVLSGGWLEITKGGGATFSISQLSVAFLVPPSSASTITSDAGGSIAVTSTGIVSLSGPEWNGVGKITVTAPNPGAIAIDDVVMAVNAPPHAEAGADQPDVEATSPAGGLTSLDGSVSYDPEGGQLTFQWTAEGIAFDDPESKTPIALFPLGSTPVHLRVQDPQGGTGTDWVRITVTDTGPPEIMAPGPLTFEANTTYGAVSVDIGNAIATDIADPSPMVTNDAPTLLPLGASTVTWTATDDHGNSATDTQTVTVIDTTPPDISAPVAASVEANAKGGAEGDVFGSASASDIADPEPVVTNDVPALIPLGTTTVTWTATDDHGNFATDTQLVTVVDTTPPEITAPDHVSAEANAEGGATGVTIGVATAIDIADPSPIVENDAMTFFPLGANVIMWTATDSHGNSATATQVVTVVDTTPPGITAPGPVSVEANTAGGAIGIPLGVAIADDIADPAPAITSDAPSLLPLGSTTVTWTAMDRAGNFATNVQMVMVIDTASPEITAPGSMSVEANVEGGAAAVDLGTVITSDTADPMPTVVNDAPPLFPLGLTTVSWTATDDSGNFATDTQLVTVIDTTPPEITAPDPVSAEANAEGGATGVEIGIASTTDVADPVPAITNDTPALLPLGPTTVTWTVIDGSGNLATDTQLVTVVDTIPPEITPPEPLTAEANAEGGATGIDLGAASTSDIADPIPAITNDAPGLLPIGSVTVTWTTTDWSGNLATATQLVTVVDTISPEITAPDPASVEANATGGAIGADLGEPAVSDIADPVPVITNDAPELLPLGSTTVTWTATDGSGNFATDTQLVMVVDTTPPEITAPDPATTEANATGGATGVDIGMAGASDIADPAPVITNDAPALFSLGATTVTWMATDGAANLQTDTQLVTVVDTTPPDLTVPDDVVFEPVGPGPYLVEIGAAFTSDIADPAPMITNDAPALFPLGVTIVTWTATDGSGNFTTGTQSILVSDTSPPDIAPTFDGVMGEEDWWISKVIVSWEVSDLESEIVGMTGCETVTVDYDTSGIGFTCKAVSAGGSTEASVTVKRDATAPALTWGTRSPAPNTAGWNSGDVSIPFVPSDAMSGVATTSVPGPLVLTEEGVAVSEAVSVTDVAGNSAAFDSPSVNIDRTPPVITTYRTPANPHGWNNASVTVQFDGHDVLSGFVPGPVPDAYFEVILMGEGAGQSISHIFADLAGNSAEAMVSDINIDLTSPVVTATRSPANSFGWNRNAVVVQFSGHDDLSGFPPWPTPDANVEVILAEEGADQSVSHIFTDLAGNTTGMVVTGINIDRTRPDATIAVPGEGAAFMLDEVVLAEWGAVDPLAGIAEVSATGDSGSPIDTSTSGTHLFTLTATDRADNVASVTHTYRVSLTGIDLKAGALTRLGPYRDDSKWIERSIRYLENSLSADLWIDADHLNLKKGHKVFDRERQAARMLELAIKHYEKRPDKYVLSPGVLAAIEDAIDDMLVADRLLTTTMISDVEAGGPLDPKTRRKVERDLEKAYKDLARADAATADGDADRALTFYGKAWKHARDAARTQVKPSRRA